MTPQEREQLFNEFYENNGLPHLFTISQPEPSQRLTFSSEDDDAHPEPPSDEQRLAQFSQHIAPRELDPQFRTMPPFLRKIMAAADSDSMADILYLGSLAVLSSCLPGVRGSWFSETQQCNLFFFLTGSAASGKGRLKLCNYLVEPLNDLIFKESQSIRKNWFDGYINELPSNQRSRVSYSSNLPDAPSVHRFVIPANSSAPSMYEDIAKNDGRGLIFETEADTLALALRRGDFSDLLRKAFHGEPISLRRKTHQEDLYVPNPYLSICLSGTPEQATTLLKNAENGLFSRFLFYRINAEQDPSDPLQQTDALALKLYFTQLGNQVRDFYTRLLSHSKGIEILFSKSQIDTLADSVTNYSLQYSDLFRQAYASSKAEEAAISISRRMGLIIFRIAMIRTALRYIGHHHLPTSAPCLDDDFYDALVDSKFLIQHSHIIYDELVNPSSDDLATDSPYEDLATDSPDMLDDDQRQFFNQLPDAFTIQDLLILNKQFNLSRSTLYRRLNTLQELGLIQSVSRGRYKKHTPKP